MEIITVVGMLFFLKFTVQLKLDEYLSFLNSVHYFLHTILGPVILLHDIHILNLNDLTSLKS